MRNVHRTVHGLVRACTISTNALSWMESRESLVNVAKFPYLESRALRWTVQRGRGARRGQPRGTRGPCPRGRAYLLRRALRFPWPRKTPLALNSSRTRQPCEVGTVHVMHPTRDRAAWRALARRPAASVGSKPTGGDGESSSSIGRCAGELSLSHVRLAMAVR